MTLQVAPESADEICRGKEKAREVDMLVPGPSTFTGDVDVLEPRTVNIHQIFDLSANRSRSLGELLTGLAAEAMLAGKVDVFSTRTGNFYQSG